MAHIYAILDQAIKKSTRNFSATSSEKISPTLKTKLGTEVETNYGQNWGQTEDKLETNCDQNQYKLETKWRQTRDRTGDKLETKVGTKLETNISAEFLQNIRTNSVSLMSGLKRDIILYLFDLSKFAEKNYTPALTISNISQHCNSSVIAVKKCLQRLTKQQIIYRAYYQNGRSGWTIYKLSTDIFNELIHKNNVHFQNENIAQTSNKLGTEVGTKLGTTLPSSSNYINKTITNTLPEDWQKIDLTPLESIGLTQKHLVDIYRIQPTNATVVQTSIMHFAFGLEHNREKYQKYKDPLNVLIGVLRKGSGWYESNYESPQTLAVKELAKHQTAESERRKIYEKELCAAQFDQWQLSLTAEQRDQYLTKLKGKIFGPIDAHLRHYFMENVWPQIRPTEVSG